MWDDDSDRDDSGLDESSARPPRRRREEPVDLPIGRGESGVARSAEPPAAPPAEATPRRKKAPPLFPDWDPTGSGEQRGAGVRERPELAPPTFDGIAPVRIDDHGSVALTARALSGLTDLAMALLAAGILIVAVRLTSGGHFARGGTVWVLAFAVELALVAGVLSLFLFGRTPGMAIVGIHAEELDGYSPRFQRASARILWSLAGLALPGVGLVLAAVRDDHRSLTDLLSGTVLRESATPTLRPGDGEHDAG